MTIGSPEDQPGRGGRHDRDDRESPRRVPQVGRQLVVDVAPVPGEQRFRAHVAPEHRERDVAEGVREEADRRDDVPARRDVQQERGEEEHHGEAPRVAEEDPSPGEVVGQEAEHGGRRTQREDGLDVERGEARQRDEREHRRLTVHAVG